MLDYVRASASICRHWVQIMIGQNATALQQTGPKQDMLHASTGLANGGEHATLILDRTGRILSCGAPAEKIFGASQVHLMGRWISEFIAGPFRAGSSPSYGARYLAHLCADGEWRKVEAKDAGGFGFTVEFNLSQATTRGQEIFLLNVRGAGETRDA